MNTIELVRGKDTKACERKELLDNARAAGYFTKRGAEDECPICKAMRIKFNKSNRPYLYACINGHRWTQTKWMPNKGKCKNPGCRNTIYRHEMETNDGYCWKCRPCKSQNASTTEKSSIKSKNLPANKDSKEGAQQSVVM